MNRKRGSIRAIATVAQVCVLAVVIAVSHHVTGARATGSIAISGTVTNQSGSGVANVSVTADAPGTTTVDFGPTTTASDGSYTLFVDAGSYDFHFDSPSSSGLTPVVDNNVTVFGNQTINIQLVPLPPAKHTFSGRLTDQNSNPLSGFKVSAGGVSTLTDGNGNFGGITLDAGKYPVEVDTPNGGTTYGVWTGQEGGDRIDLTNGDVAQNLQVNLVALTVVVKDSNGNPVASATVVGGGQNGVPTAPLFVGSTTQATVTNYETYQGTTDANGTYTTLVPVGSNFNNGISASASGQWSASSTPLIVTQPTNIVLQHAPPVPSAPTITAPRYAQHPLLTWPAVSGATSYNIYRNGSRINPSPFNSTANPVSYTDNPAPEGNQTYCVTAVNSGGESPCSNSVNVLVDRTAPTITYTISPTPNSSGWNNTSPVTVTYTCTDNTGGSGIASCSPPQSEPAEGTYTLTGYAADNAGNTSSVTVTINIDTTAPTISNVSVSPSTITQNSSTTLSATVNDTTSGVAKAEYFVGTDPGQGLTCPRTFLLE